MDEAATVSIVWVTEDWDQAPVDIDASPAFDLPGQTGQTQTGQSIRQGHCTIAAGTTVASLADKILSPAGRQQIEAGTHGITVFGRRVRAGYVLSDGDRIELAGPVTADPKADRHQRVARERHARGRTMWKK